MPAKSGSTGYRCPMLPKLMACEGESESAARVATPTTTRLRPHLSTFEVATTLPEPLRPLDTLAQNLWWSWNHDARELFARLHPEVWDSCDHNPIKLLQGIPEHILIERSNDSTYLEQLASVRTRFDAYMSAPMDPVLTQGTPLSMEHPVAYLCAEFGIHESLRVYSGGLGVLAGDHLKSASDLGVPLIGVGLFYHKGYMRQTLTENGEQVYNEAVNDPRTLPIRPITDRDGQLVELSLQFPTNTVLVRAWRVDVGRVPLYLLDTDFPENRHEDRAITHALYGGDHEMRLRQEFVLGIGAVVLLAQLGIDPAVFHMNEGHPAFAPLERIARLMRERGLTFDEAREIVRGTTLFTTHTPIPAGHDAFGEDLMQRYFEHVQDWIGVEWQRFYALGQPATDGGDLFNMTYLAVGMSSYVNGVSKRHGEVSRALLRAAWPGLLESEIPIDSITNGVHLSTWTNPRISALLGARDGSVCASDFRESAKNVDLEQLWEVRHAARDRLLTQLRKRIERSAIERHASPRKIERILQGLTEDAMLIGFARRFTGYKRAYLLSQDEDRLAKLLGSQTHPVRLVFAGKAHPRDGIGQDILKRVFTMSLQEPFLGKLIFVENYELELAQALVQGVDLWINTPVRGLEASGTSGMKVAVNGGINLSVPDGWWIEGYDGRSGWTIGEIHGVQDPMFQDELDTAALYQLLEEDIVPEFYRRDRRGVPIEWLERMRHSLATLGPMFNTDRMVLDYHERAYQPCSRRFVELTRDHSALAKLRAARKQRLRGSFAEVGFVKTCTSDLQGLKVGDEITVEAHIRLGDVQPDDVLVELALGHAKSVDDLSSCRIVPLTCVGAVDERVLRFSAKVPMVTSGSFGFGVRVRPRPDDPFDDDLADQILWCEA